LDPYPPKISSLKCSGLRQVSISLRLSAGGVLQWRHLLEVEGKARLEVFLGQAGKNQVRTPRELLELIPTIEHDSQKMVIFVETSLVDV
jgi:hypothetical protein